MKCKNLHPVLKALLGTVLLFVLTLDGPLPLEQRPGPTRELIDMSIEELMEVPVICDSEPVADPSTDIYFRLTRTA